MIVRKSLGFDLFDANAELDATKSAWVGDEVVVLATLPAFDISDKAIKRQVATAKISRANLRIIRSNLRRADAALQTRGLRALVKAHAKRCSDQ